MGTHTLRDIRAAQRAVEQKRKSDRQRENAQNEMEAFDAWIRHLLTVHHSVGPHWDWASIACLLPPPPPVHTSWKEQRLKQRAILPGTDTRTLQATLAEARLADEAAYNEGLVFYRDSLAELQKFQRLAERILAGDPKSFTEAVVEINPFAELAGFGTSIHLTVHSPGTIECGIKVKGTKIIPDEMKTLTQSGKVSTKRMPKARFHELYQDHVSSCVLRVAREFFALLPVETVLVTALINSEDSRDQPVLSVAISRGQLNQVDFISVDPSTIIDQLPHRGDFKASRKTQAFLPIVPLTASDLNLVERNRNSSSFNSLLAAVRHLRQEIGRDSALSSPSNALPEFETPLYA